VAWTAVNALLSHCLGQGVLRAFGAYDAALWTNYAPYGVSGGPTA
jgi:hypothetical protein